MMNRFLSTLSIVSRIPVKLPFRFDPSRMDFYLPVTGVFPALMGFLIFAIGSFVFDFQGGPDTAGFPAGIPAGIPALLAVIILIVQYLSFNLFHLDGLMDTADAFLGSADRKKRIDILKDSRTGVYGFFAGAACLGLKAVLVYSLFRFARGFPALVFAYPLWGRFSAALIPCMSKPLNPDGLGALAKDSRPHRCFFGMVCALFLWGLLSMSLSALVSQLNLLTGLPAGNGIFPLGAMSDFFPVIVAPALCLFVLSPLTAFCYARLYKTSLGGYTGDTLGAAIETAEILCQLTTLVVLFFVNAR